MKFDEWAVRRWLESHPDHAKRLLTEVATAIPPAVPQVELDTAGLSPRALHASQLAAHGNFIPGGHGSQTSGPDSVLGSLHQYEFIFDMAKMVYSSLDLQTVIESVLSIAANLINAERCSVFLVDKATNELYTLAFDVDGGNTAGPTEPESGATTGTGLPVATAAGASNGHLPAAGQLGSTGVIAHHGSNAAVSTGISSIDLLRAHSKANLSNMMVPQTANSALIIEDIESNERARHLAGAMSKQHRPNPGIRIPIGQGVAGYVAQTRQGLNIKDAYADSRFNPAIDKQTGFKTESILCLPIFGPMGEDGSPELVGVASLVNKLGPIKQASSVPSLASPEPQRAGAGATANANGQAVDQSANRNLLGMLLGRSRGESAGPPAKANGPSTTADGFAVPKSPTQPLPSASATSPTAPGTRLSATSQTIREKLTFSDEDAILYKHLLVLVGIAIKNAKQYEMTKRAQEEASMLAKRNAELYEKARQETEKGKILLQLASTLYREDDTKELIKKIVGLAKDLMHADKASFFIVDTEKQHLTSTVFDSGTESSFSVPLNKGIAGYVATTGKIVNLQDAYTDDRFNPEVDIKTNYRTRTILSVPVPGPKGNIVGVANLINKQPSGPNDTATPVFNVIDEEIFNSFAVFCGLALHKTMLLEEIDKQRQRLAITMEIMSFHSIVRDEETKALMDQVTGKTIPLDQLRSLTFDPHVFPHSDETLASITYQMFVDLSYGKRYDIPNEKLINYILTVRKNYRPVPYHNFTHAVSVTHAFYTLVVDGTLDGLLDHLERFAVFVACLNHDIDHRGTNNQFQKQAHTELANFYSTSTMERHHFNHAMTILSHGTGLNILEHLNTADYQRVLKIIEQSILATDLGMFFANRGKVNEILKNKNFNVAQTEHKDLLRGAIMTCCDLGAMYKPWKSSRSTADSVYEEFFQQGDEEKRLGMRLSAELMDRDKTPEIPRMQYDFYNFIVVPAYEQLFGFLGERVKPQYDAVLANKAKWKDLKDSGVAYKFGVDL